MQLMGAIARAGMGLDYAAALEIHGKCRDGIQVVLLTEKRDMTTANSVLGAVEGQRQRENACQLSAAWHASESRLLHVSVADLKVITKTIKGQQAVGA